MFSYQKWGNELYTGERTYQIVGKGRFLMGIGGALMAASVLIVAVFGFALGIEFRGGSQFTITGSEVTSQQPAYDVLKKAGHTEGVRVSNLGQSSLRVQTSQLSDADTREVREGLAEAYKVDESAVASTFVGPTWGKDVSTKALQGLATFLTLVAIVMAIYFRRWTMSVAALFALLHDILITVGVFAVTRVEVTPATVIGFLTILGYSLYDTVVVFDKVRENTRGFDQQHRYTFGELVNLAANQTMVRSINTSIVAILPVGSILLLGSLLLGSGTLTDIALALFVGMIVGTFSSIFIASPMLVVLEQAIKGRVKEHTAEIRAKRGHSDAVQVVDHKVVAKEDETPRRSKKRADVVVEQEPEYLSGPGWEEQEQARAAKAPKTERKAKTAKKSEDDAAAAADEPRVARPMQAGGHRGNAAQPKKRKKGKR